jgi:hypothetical protein
MHQGGAFFVSLALPESSPIYQSYNQAAMDEMTKVVAAAQAGKNLPMDKAAEASRALEEDTKIGIRVAINSGGAGMVNFKTGHTVKPLPGGGFTLEVPYEQPPGGGGPDGAQRILHVFFGAWAAAPTSKPSGAGEDIAVKATLDASPANLLKVQNVSIRIQAGTEQAQQLIKLIDWGALQALTAGK